MLNSLIMFGLSVSKSVKMLSIEQVFYSTPSLETLSFHLHNKVQSPS